MSKFDVFQEVTDKIITALESGTSPWKKPWKDNGLDPFNPHNAVSGRSYNGINWLLLSLAPYASTGWLTYKQAQAIGGNVKKGEKGTMITYWQFIEKEDNTKFPMVRAFTVFNVEQCENLDESKMKKATDIIQGETDINEIAKSIGATVRHGGNRAYYTTNGDFISIPSMQDFIDIDNYKATLAHELVHWTGHKSRCDRQFGNRFGDNAYAFEELVAEIGSAFIGAKLSLDFATMQHDSYINSWLKVLKEDKRAIFTAASQAKKAVDFIFDDNDQTEEDA